MAQGKKHNDETRERALALLVTNNNLSEVAKQLGLPESTLKGWKKQAEKDEDFAELRRKKKSEFVDAAWKSIESALKLGQRRIDRALDHEEELQVMIDEIANDGELHPSTKQALIAKLKTLQVQGIRDISTFVGTLYDKQALAIGDVTGRVDVQVSRTADLLDDELDALLSASRSAKGE